MFHDRHLAARGPPNYGPCTTVPLTASLCGPASRTVAPGGIGLIGRLGQADSRGWPFAAFRVPQLDYKRDRGLTRTLPQTWRPGRAHFKDILSPYKGVLCTCRTPHTHDTNPWHSNKRNYINTCSQEFDAVHPYARYAQTGYRGDRTYINSDRSLAVCAKHDRRARVMLQPIETSLIHRLVPLVVEIN